MSLSDVVLKSAGDGAAPGAVEDWYREQLSRRAYSVRKIPLEDVRGWLILGPPVTVAHCSGKFFSIFGLRVESDFDPPTAWQQPIMQQPEIGILGLIVRCIEGRLHLLVQSKFEPGNVNGIQLAPTLQATRSNYTRVHTGKQPSYLEYFRRAPGTQIHVDQVQPEHGGFFIRKYNRNMVVSVDGDIPLAPNFCWMTLTDLRQFMGLPNAVGMNLRSVLACLLSSLAHQRAPGLPARADNRAGLGRSRDGALTWFNDILESGFLRRRRCGLDQLPQWKFEDGELRSSDGAPFTIGGIAVTGDDREVERWEQPVFMFGGVGLVGLITRHVDGERQVLVRASLEPGHQNLLAPAPTYVSYGSSSRFIDGGRDDARLFERCGPGKILYDTVLSEEGGRFANFQNRYVIVEIPAAEQLSPRPGCGWVPLSYLQEQIGCGALSMELRTCLAWFGLTQLAASL